MWKRNLDESDKLGAATDSSNTRKTGLFGTCDLHSLVVSAWKLSDTIMVEKAFLASIKEAETLRMRHYKDERGKGQVP